MKERKKERMNERKKWREREREKDRKSQDFICLSLLQQKSSLSTLRSTAARKGKK